MLKAEFLKFLRKADAISENQKERRKESIPFGTKLHGRSSCGRTRNTRFDIPEPPEEASFNPDPQSVCQRCGRFIALMEEVFIETS